MPQSSRLSPEQEAELIRLVKAGDADPFGEIVRSYESRIFATVYRILGHAEDARELAQEVFLRAWSKLATFREGARFSTWLYTIALNLTRSELRKRKVRQGLRAVSLDTGPGENSRPEPPAPLESPDDVLGRNELYDLALDRIDRLEPEAKEVIVLRDMQDLSYGEIAEVLECPVGTVRSRLHRARESLRESLAPLIGARRKGGAA